MSIVEDFSAASAGAAGAAFSSVSMYPLDTIKTRMSNGVDERGVEYKNEWDTIKRTLREHGVSSFYLGVQGKVAHAVLQKFVYFYSYNYLRRYALSDKKGLSVRANLAVGYCAALSSVFITTPVEVSQTRQQVGTARGSLLQVMAQMCKTEGPSSLYKGLGTNVILCINPAIEFTVFDQLKSAYLRRNGGGKNLTALQAFLLGAVAKAVATVVTYPYVRAKILQQVSKSDQNTGGLKKTESAARIIEKVIREDGVGGAYKGIQAQLLKGVLTSALMLMTKESLEGRVRRAVYRLLAGQG